MDFFNDLDSLTRVIFSIAFILVAIGVSRWQQADLEKDLAIATFSQFLPTHINWLCLRNHLRAGQPCVDAAGVGDHDDDCCPNNSASCPQPYPRRK